jgi:hypothetical protein
VPLDVYTIGPGAMVALETTGTGAQMQYTPDDVFNSAITPAWFNLGSASAGSNVIAQTSAGARAVRCTGMVSADVLVVSQQGVR